MGLISWIKNTHYDHRLQKADKLVEEKDYNGASTIYKSLLGKQPMAVVHYSRMLVGNSTSCSLMLQNLKAIEGMKEYLVEVNSSEYQSILSAFTSSLNKESEACFSRKAYEDAVSLIDAVHSYFVKQQGFIERRNQYHAWLCFSNSQTKNVYGPDYANLLQFASGYSSSEDIETFVSELFAQRRFSRIVTLLLPIVKHEKTYEQKIIECSVLIVEGKDSEILSVKSLLAFCSDKNINKKTSKKLWELSKRAEGQSSFVKCVQYDNIAGEYLSDDEEFNFDRCMHRFGELAPRCNADEVNQLLGFVKSVKLQQESHDSVIDKIYELAASVSPEKSVPICSLLKDEARFRSLYIQKAYIIVQSKKSSLDLGELKSVIIANTDSDSVVDTLAPFVQYVKEYTDWFVDIASNKVKRKADVALLEQYWGVCPSGRYFTVLVAVDYEKSELFAKHISAHYDKYLGTKSLVSLFCDSLVKLPNQEFTLDILESLIANNIDVQSYYVGQVQSITEEKLSSNAKDALDLVNRALGILPSQSIFLNLKKRIIRVLNEQGEYEIALSEANSMTSLDEEAYTILAEIHLAKALSSKGNKAKKKELFEVLSLNEQHNLLESFGASIEKTLSELVETANKLFEVDEDDAFSICERIEPYKEQWIQLYLQLRNRGFNSESTLVQKIKYQKESLEHVISKVPKVALITNPLYYELWESHIDAVIEKSKSQPCEKAILSLHQVTADVAGYCPIVYEKTFTNLIKHAIQYIWTIATDLESAGDYTKAIEQYAAIIDEANSCEPLPLSWLDHDTNVHPSTTEMRIMVSIVKAERRSLICRLKAGLMESSVEEAIKKTLSRQVGTSGIEEDLAYRYAYYLLEQTRPAEAIDIIRSYIPNEKELLDFCMSIFAKRAELDLREFNDKLSLLKDKKMSSVDAESFLSEVDAYKEKISKYLPDTESKFDGYKEKIRTYILGALFDEEKYREVYDWLRKTSSNYVTQDDNAFRNIAIAALRMIESNSVNGVELKRAISIFVTAVFTDRLFVKSLDYTEWDDEYRFTLRDSLGDADFDELPDNICYDDPIENQIISIRDVQLSLLNRLELTLRENYPSAEAFFQEEKSAVESLVDLHLDQKCTIVAPYLSKDFKELRDAIADSFAVDLEKDYGNHEQIYELGVKYGFTGQVYTKYAMAIDYLNACIKALDELNANSLSSAFSSSYVSSIREFDKLFSELKSKVVNTISKAVKDEMEYRRFLDLFFDVCTRMRDNNISFACTQYVNGQVVRRLNAKTMELRVGAEYLYKLYQLTPSNIQVKENLEGVLQQLAEKCETGGTSSDKSTLNTILSGTGNTFSSAIVTAKVGGIAANLKSEKISAKQALEQAYELYRQDNTNDIVCGVLVALCIRCIHEYIISDAYGRSSVESLLDRIAANRSQKFLLHAKEIAKQYNGIWSKLDIENKLLLSGTSLPTRSLNDKGRALKAGLDYMKKLAPAGSVSTGLGLRGFDNLFL